MSWPGPTFLLSDAMLLVGPAFSQPPFGANRHRRLPSLCHGKHVPLVSPSSSPLPFLPSPLSSSSLSPPFNPSMARYQSIHIVGATGCTISVSPACPVAGPVHATSCRGGTSVSVACRQLRVHDCDGATFDVHVRSGPIIEGCRDVTFRGEYRPDAAEAVAEGEADQNMYHDVKDFNWQRAGMKSPNFVVVPVLSPGLGVPPSAGGAAAADGQGAVSASAGVAAPADQRRGEEGSDGEEDEL